VVLLDERPGEIGPDAIELVGAVRRFANQDDARVTDGVEHRVQAATAVLEPEPCVPDDIDRRVGSHCSPPEREDGCNRGTPGDGPAKAGHYYPMYGVSGFSRTSRQARP
jgi:hypothetical protein